MLRVIAARWAADGHEVEVLSTPAVVQPDGAGSVSPAASGWTGSPCAGFVARRDGERHPRAGCPGGEHGAVQRTGGLAHAVRTLRRGHDLDVAAGRARVGCIGSRAGPALGVRLPLHGRASRDRPAVGRLRPTGAVPPAAGDGRRHLSSGGTGRGALRGHGRCAPPPTRHAVAAYAGHRQHRPPHDGRRGGHGRHPRPDGRTAAARVHRQRRAVPGARRRRGRTGAARVPHASSWWSWATGRSCRRCAQGGAARPRGPGALRRARQRRDRAGARRRGRSLPGEPDGRRRVAGLPEQDHDLPGRGQAGARRRSPRERAGGLVRHEGVGFVAPVDDPAAIAAALGTASASGRSSAPRRSAPVPEGRR